MRHALKIRPAGRGTAIVVLDGRSIGLVREAGFPEAKWTAERVDRTLLDGLFDSAEAAADAIAKETS